MTPEEVAVHWYFPRTGVPSAKLLVSELFQSCEPVRVWQKSRRERGRSNPPICVELLKSESRLLGGVDQSTGRGVCLRELVAEPAVGFSGFYGPRHASFRDTDGFLDAFGSAQRLRQQAARDLALERPRRVALARRNSLLKPGDGFARVTGLEPQPTQVLIQRRHPVAGRRILRSRRDVKAALRPRA